MHQAKSQLSKLLEQVEAGEEVVIARNGTPVVTLVPHRGEAAAVRRGRGVWRGRVDMGRFAAADEEIAREFGMR